MSPFLVALLAAAHQPGAEAPAPAAEPGVSTGRLQAMFRARIMASDANKDGSLSSAEYVAMRAALPNNGGASDPARTFARMDTDGDKLLSPAEIGVALTARIARVDANKDGIVTREEGAASTGAAE